VATLSQPKLYKICIHCSQSLTRACSGWPQHSGSGSKNLATAEAQAVRLEQKKLGESDWLRLVSGSKNRLWFSFWWWQFIEILSVLKILLRKDFARHHAVQGAMTGCETFGD
jgi:hypothetical protein